MYEIYPVPPRPLARDRACPGSPSEFSTCSSNAPADHSRESLAVMPRVDPSIVQSEYGLSLVEGTITLNGASFITNVNAYKAFSRQHAAPAGHTLS